MALDITNDQAVTDFVNRLYRENLGDNAGTEGHDYWGGQIRAGTLDPNDLAGHLQWSHEGQQYADRKAQDLAAGIDTTERWVGGVNPNMSLNAQIDANAFNDKSYTYDRPAWIGKYDAGIGGERATQSLMGDLQNINNELGLNRTYTGYDSNTTKNAIANTIADNAANNNSTDGTGTGDTGTGSTNWWDQYADIDAFKDALGLGTNNQSGGIDDFMKFMMFMSVLRPQGGGGYGGSQYGYGGLNPGGVMSAYNPMDNIASAISAFQSIPGIGTNLTNTGAAGGNSGN